MPHRLTDEDLTIISSALSCYNHNAKYRELRERIEEIAATRFTVGRPKTPKSVEVTRQEASSGE